MSSREQTRQSPIVIAAIASLIFCSTDAFASTVDDLSPGLAGQIAQETEDLKSSSDAGLERRWSELKADPSTSHLTHEKARALGYWTAAGENMGLCPRQLSEADKRLWFDKLSILQLGYVLEAQFAAKGRLALRRATIATSLRDSADPLESQSCEVALAAARQVLAELPSFAPTAIALPVRRTLTDGYAGSNSDIAAPLRASQAANQSVTGGDDDQFRKLFDNWQNFEETRLTGLSAVAEAAGQSRGEQPRLTTRPASRPTLNVRPAPKRRSVGRSFYANCSAARAAGAAPVRSGDPGYSRRLDRDGDGVGCE